MVVVHFEVVSYIVGGCYGDYDKIARTEVKEFDSVHDWLKYRQGKKVIFRALYEVCKAVYPSE